MGRICAATADLLDCASASVWQAYTSPRTSRPCACISSTRNSSLMYALNWENGLSCGSGQASAACRQERVAGGVGGAGGRQRREAFEVWCQGGSYVGRLRGCRTGCKACLSLTMSVQLYSSSVMYCLCSRQHKHLQVVRKHHSRVCCSCAQHPTLV